MLKLSRLFRWRPLSVHRVRGRSNQQISDNEHKSNSRDEYITKSKRYKVFYRHATTVFRIDEETTQIHEYKLIQNLTCNSSWQNLSKPCDTNKLIEAFQQMLAYSKETDIALSDERFDEFVNLFTQQLATFTANELLLALQIFANHPMKAKSYRQSNTIELWMAFDQFSTIQADRFTSDQLILLSSIWQRIPWVTESFTAKYISRRLNRRMKVMSASQLIPAMYYISCFKSSIENVSAFEMILEETIDDMTIEDLSIVAWSFQQNPTKPQNSRLQAKFMEKLEKHRPAQMNEVFLRNIFLFVSGISRDVDPLILANILKIYRNTLKSYALQTCIAIAYAGAARRIFDDVILFDLLERCSNHSDQLEQLSMIDLEYLSRCLCVLHDYQHMDLVKSAAGQLLNEMKRRLNDVAKRNFFPSFVRIIRNLTLIDTYDIELLANIFRSDFIQHLLKTNMLDLRVYELDGYARINLINIYRGDYIPEAELSKLRWLIKYIPDRIGNHQPKHLSFYAIEDAIGGLFEKYQIKQAIPWRLLPDIFVCLNLATMLAEDISQNFPQIYTGRFIDAKSLTKSQPNLIMLAFISSDTLEYEVDESNKWLDYGTSYTEQKCQQLQLLGFHTIVIPSNQPTADLSNFIMECVANKLKQLEITNEMSPKLNIQ